MRLVIVICVLALDFLYFSEVCFSDFLIFPPNFQEELCVITNYCAAQQFIMIHVWLLLYSVQVKTIRMKTVRFDQVWDWQPADVDVDGSSQ